MAPVFSLWASWKNRHSLPGLEFPGVYAIAFSKRSLDAKEFSWCKEIIYIGMTNQNVDGLMGRLNQFDNTINGKDGHGGASRVRHKHSSYMSLIPHLFVSICAFKCDVKSNKPRDLRTMGDVARHEYECFARFVEKFGVLPEFNDKKRSPKK